MVVVGGNFAPSLPRSLLLSFSLFLSFSLLTLLTHACHLFLLRTLTPALPQASFMISNLHALYNLVSYLNISFCVLQIYFFSITTHNNINCRKVSYEFFLFISFTAFCRGFYCVCSLMHLSSGRVVVVVRLA